jgi:hypothetical protein
VVVDAWSVMSSVVVDAAGVTVTVSIEVIVLVLPIEGHVEGELIHADQEVTVVVAVQPG